MQSPVTIKCVLGLGSKMEREDVFEVIFVTGPAPE